MKGIIVTGHGEFAHGMSSLVNAVLGEIEQCAFVPFSFDSNPDELLQTLKATAKEIDTGDGVIFCADIINGTPFRTSVLIANDNDNHIAIGGCNFTSIVAASELRETIKYSHQLQEEIVNEARNGIASLFSLAQLMKERSNFMEGDDGI